MWLGSSENMTVSGSEETHVQWKYGGIYYKVV